MKKAKAPKLSSKQALFVVEYLIDLNATQAAIRAGYSEKTAQVQGSRLLSNAMVSSALAEKQSKRFQKREITADRLIDELAKMAFVDTRKFFTADGSLVPVHELDDDTAASLAGLEVNELFEGEGEQKHAYGLLKKIKISDKLRAIELLGKHLRVFGEKEAEDATNKQLDAMVAALKAGPVPRGQVNES